MQFEICGVAIGESPPPPSLKIQYAGVAQLAAQVICNHQVAGSIPVASSKISRQFYNCRDIFVSILYFVAQKGKKYPRHRVSPEPGGRYIQENEMD